MKTARTTKSEHLTDAEIRALGWHALVDKLSPSGAVRFAVQTERGHGDYVELRHQMLGDLTVDELLERMRKSAPAGPPAARPRKKKSEPASSRPARAARRAT